MGGVKASDGVRKQLGPCERHGTDDDPAYGRALQSSDFVQAVLQLVPGQTEARTTIRPALVIATPRPRRTKRVRPLAASSSLTARCSEGCDKPVAALALI